jgi:hypothetical protein
VTIGNVAAVCTKSDNVIVREQPSGNSRELFRISPGTQIVVIGGAACANDSSWWQVEVPAGIYVRQGSFDAPLYELSSTTIGWVREGSDNIDRYFICKVN